MFPWQRSLVYRSKDKADWDKAQSLLRGSGIGYYPLAADEPPVAGCGAKIDPRRFLHEKTIPSKLYSIEVAKADKDAAKEILKGKVQAVRSYGYGL